MKTKAVLFDLDGTLLPMDQEIFVKAYIGGLIKAATPRGYEPKQLANAIQAGTYAMIKNTGEVTNEGAFWNCMSSVYGRSVIEEFSFFEEFYRTDFQRVKEVCGICPRAKELLKLIKAKGLRAVLATNPLFPSVATESRIRWAGLDPCDFEFFTSYENSHYCKPNPEYYREVLAKTNLAPEECIMVGNDTDEDMIAETLGMKVFLLTDCLINRSAKDISAYPNGNIDELIEFMEMLD